MMCQQVYFGEDSLKISKEISKNKLFVPFNNSTYYSFFYGVVAKENLPNQISLEGDLEKIIVFETKVFGGIFCEQADLAVFNLVHNCPITLTSAQ